MTKHGKNQPYVTIVLVNWNGWEDTVECIKSIRDSDYSNCQVVVCDNASTDGSLEKMELWAANNLQQDQWQTVSENFIRDLEPTSINEQELQSKGISDRELVYVKADSNLGFAGGNNLGIRLALIQNEFDYIWLLNNDTVIENNTLNYLIKRLMMDGKAGMCGGTLLYYHRPNTVQAFGGATYNQWTGLARHIGALCKWPNNPDREIIERQLSYVAGASLLVSKKFIQEIGLMSEDYFLYFEEIDWITRAKGRFNLVFEPKAVVYHKEGASIGSNIESSKRSYKSYFWLLRSRLIYTKKYFPLAIPSVVLVAIIQLLRHSISNKTFKPLYVGISGMMQAIFPKNIVPTNRIK